MVDQIGGYVDAGADQINLAIRAPWDLGGPRCPRRAPGRRFARERARRSSPWVSGSASPPAGSRSKGGQNGPGEPPTTGSTGSPRAGSSRSGIAVDFWNRYEEHLDRVAAMGCDAFRLSVEWSRCEPADGQVDDDAIERYRRDPHRLPRSGPRTAGHPPPLHPPALARRRLLAGPVARPSGSPPGSATLVPAWPTAARNWVTLNELNILALSSYWLGAFPPGRLWPPRTPPGPSTTCSPPTSWPTTRSTGSSPTPSWPPTTCRCRPTPWTGCWPTSSSPGSTASSGATWCPGSARRRDDWERALGPAGIKERAVRTLAARAIPLGDAIPRTVEAVYASPHLCTQDVTQLDFYDPGVGHQLQVPGARTAGGRTTEPGLPSGTRPTTPPPSPSTPRPPSPPTGRSGSWRTACAIGSATAGSTTAVTA